MSTTIAPSRPMSEQWAHPSKVWRLAPALETCYHWAHGEMDGELYWTPGRKGDVPGVCLRTQEHKVFHPFANDGGDRLPVGVSADCSPATIGPYGAAPNL